MSIHFNIKQCSNIKNTNMAETVFLRPSQNPGDATSWGSVKLNKIKILENGSNLIFETFFRNSTTIFYRIKKSTVIDIFLTRPFIYTSKYVH